ncbi:Phage integrase family protein [Halomonas sp. TD01]|nr:Phage integrase family protein [Halomonas sp. TD01]
MNVSTEISFTPWNKGKLVGQKTPLRLRDIWAIRVQLQLAKKDTRSCPLQFSHR